MCAPSSTTPPRPEKRKALAHHGDLNKGEPSSSSSSSGGSTAGSNVLKCKILYLLLFASFGTFAPLMSLLYRGYGLSAQSIGMLSLISPGK